MRKFSGSPGNKFVFCFKGVFLAGSLSLILKQLDSVPSGLTIAWKMMGLLFGAGIFAAGYGLLEAFTSYRVDANGVTRRAWNGTRELQWRNLVRFKSVGREKSGMALTDSIGHTLTIEFSLLSKQDQAELRSLLEPYLAPLREQEASEILPDRFQQ